MAAVTADQLLAIETDLSKTSGPVEAATRLYAKTAAFKNSGGYIDDDTAAGANKFAGIVRDQVNNAAGADGDLDVELIVEGRFEAAISGSSQDDVGKPVYATTNFDFTLDGTAANATYVGIYARFVSSSRAMVQIDVDDPQAATIAAVTTADGSDAATTQALANQLKITVNAVIAALKACGLVAKA